VARWEYAQVANPESETDFIRFSQPQSADIVQWFSQSLGRGLKAERSDPAFLHLNLNHTTTVHVAGLLGILGWELVSHATLTGGHEYWTFKRQLSDA
jgi:hypothetical protein